MDCICMEKLQDSLKYRLWAKSLKENGLTVNGIEEKAIVRRGNGEVLFAFLTVDAKDQNGRAIPSAVLLRGHFVSVVTCLKDKDTGKRYFLLVKQRRVATGGFFYEHPAGMCDNEVDPLYVAVKEVEEETGLKIRKEQIFLLWDSMLFSSPGLLDEAGYFYGCEVELSHSEIEMFKDKLMGEEHEHEYIQTFVCPMEEASKYLQNANGILSIMLFQKYLDQKGKL